MHIDGVDNFIEAQIICYTDNYNSFFPGLFRDRGEPSGT